MFLISCRRRTQDGAAVSGMSDAFRIGTSVRTISDMVGRYRAPDQRPDPDVVVSARGLQGASWR